MQHAEPALWPDAARGIAALTESDGGLARGRPLGSRSRVEPVVQFEDPISSPPRELSPSSARFSSAGSRSSSASSESSTDERLTEQALVAMRYPTDEVMEALRETSTFDEALEVLAQLQQGRLAAEENVAQLEGMGFSPVQVAEVLRETSDFTAALDRLTTRQRADEPQLAAPERTPTAESLGGTHSLKSNPG